MVSLLNFEGSSEIGAYALLTNTYALIGKSVNPIFYSSFHSSATFPICETTLNTISTVGSLAVGNKYGLLLPNTTTDPELQHIRNTIPDIKIKRLPERYNALGNVILANDRIAIVHPDLEKETMEVIGDVLGVEVLSMSIGNEPLTGTFGRLNNVGMLVHPRVTEDEAMELSSLLKVQVIAGTVNKGQETIGGGVIVNDWIGYMGYRSTVHEMTVVNAVFKLEDEDEQRMKKALIDKHVK